MVFKIAVCPKCKWYTIPSWEGHKPVCIMCLRRSQSKLNGGTRLNVSCEALRKAQRCRVIEVVAKDSPFKRKRGPFGLNRSIIEKTAANAK